MRSSTRALRSVPVVREEGRADPGSGKFDWSKILTGGSLGGPQSMQWKETAESLL